MPFLFYTFNYINLIKDAMDATEKSKFPLVVIVGGGFAGLEVARRLEDKPVDVLMLDKHNYHTFQPLLYQVALGSLEAESIAFSLRKNFSGQSNFRFKIADVKKINTENNTIDTNIGEIAYDYLVIATGSTTNFFGNKDIEHNAMPMKSIPEALNLRYLIFQNFEEAVLQKTKGRSRALPHFCIGWRRALQVLSWRALLPNSVIL